MSTNKKTANNKIKLKQWFYMWRNNFLFISISVRINAVSSSNDVITSNNNMLYKFEGTWSYLQGVSKKGVRDFCDKTFIVSLPTLVCRKTSRYLFLTDYKE